MDCRPETEKVTLDEPQTSSMVPLMVVAVVEVATVVKKL
jgi:hypothetical protein